MIRYNYSCTSKTGTCLQGHVNWHGKFNRDDVTSVVMREVAQLAHISGIPWDPFNIQLIVQAQIEPKHFNIDEVFSDL